MKPNTVRVNTRESTNVEEKQIRTTSERAKTKRDRAAFNGTSQKLKVYTEVEGFHLHWINDYPGRVYAAEQNGYEFVSPDEAGLKDGVTPANTDVGSGRVRKLVGKQEDGSPLFAYLMKIKQEWFEENQQQVQSHVDKVDEAIRSGQMSNVEQRYGAESIKYKND